MCWDEAGTAGTTLGRRWDNSSGLGLGLGLGLGGLGNMVEGVNMHIQTIFVVYSGHIQ